MVRNILKFATSRLRKKPTLAQLEGERQNEEIQQYTPRYHARFGGQINTSAFYSWLFVNHKGRPPKRGILGRIEFFLFVFSTATAMHKMAKRGGWNDILADYTKELRYGIQQLNGELPVNLTVICNESGRYSGRSTKFEDGSYLVQINAGVFELIFLLAKVVTPFVVEEDNDGSIKFKEPGEWEFTRDMEIMSAYLQQVLEAYRLGRAPWQVTPAAVPYPQVQSLLTLVGEQFLLAHELAHIVAGHLEEKISDLDRLRENEYEADLVGMQITLLALKTTQPWLSEWAYIGVDFCLTTLHLARIHGGEGLDPRRPRPEDRQAKLRSWTRGVSQEGRDVVDVCESIHNLVVKMATVDVGGITEEDFQLIHWWHDADDEEE